MSQVIKGLLSLSLPKILRQNFRYNGRSAVSKDLLKQTAPSTDILLYNLKNARSVESVFELVNSHHSIMNNKHLMQSLQSLFVLQKHSKGDISSQKILKHPDFETICSQLQAYAGVMETRETIEALKVLTYVGVSSDSLIYQVLLQLIRHDVNQLSLAQISFLEFLLKRVKPTPLVDALQIALPIVFEVQLPTKMDRQSATRLSEYLRYISKRNVSQSCTELIVNALLINNEEWNAKTANSILWSLCDLKVDSNVGPLLTKAFHVLTKHADAVHHRELETTITKLVYRYSSSMPFYYNEKFFDVVADQVVQKDLGFEQAVHILRKLLKIDHIHNNLLDYATAMCHENPQLIKNGDPLHVNVIVCGAAMTEYRPKHWESVRESVLEIKCLNSYVGKELFWIRLASALCVLETYNEHVLNECLNEENLQNLFRKNTMIDPNNLLLVYQAIKTFKPEFSKLLPNEAYIEGAISHLNPAEDFPLQGCLQKIVGGERYVKTNIRTKLWHHIDHVIVLRKGGYPVAINTTSDTTTLEDIEVAPDSQIILILTLNASHYTINCRRLKGSTSLTIKTLEAGGYTVVPICLELWKSLLEFEKLPYIAEAIRQKSDHREHLSNAVF